jgi:hypothetical protein
MANCDGCGFMATLQRREPLPADGEVELHRQWHVQIVSRRFVSLSLTHRIPFTLHQFGKKKDYGGQPRVDLCVDFLNWFWCSSA